MSHPKIPLETVHCPVCSSDNVRPLFRGPDRTMDRQEPFGVVDCGQCNFRYTNPRPSRSGMAIFYPDTYGPYQTAILSGSEIFNPGRSWRARLKNRLKWNVLVHRYGYHHLAPPAVSLGPEKWPDWILSKVEILSHRYMRSYYPRIPAWSGGRKALDIGCGNGAHLLLLKKLGWDVYGFDIVDHTSPKVKSQAIPVLTGSLDGLAHLEGAFDLITMWHVLEHVHDPSATLRFVRKLLSARGILMMEVPNCGSLAARVFGRHWVAYDLPRHLCHFTMRTAGRLLELEGFELLQKGHVWKQHIAASLDYAAEDSRWRRIVNRILQSAAACRFLHALGFLVASVGLGEIIHLAAKKAGD